MAVDVAQAMRAYASTSGIGAGQGKESAALGDPGEFGNMVSTAIKGINDGGKATEAITANLASGKADVVDLVTAVAETEVAVQTLVAVRDKVISAYQEIMNMPI